VRRDSRGLAESLADQPDRAFVQDVGQTGVVGGGRFTQPDEKLRDQASPRQAPWRGDADERSNLGVVNGHQVPTRSASVP